MPALHRDPINVPVVTTHCIPVLIQCSCRINHSCLLQLDAIYVRVILETFQANFKLNIFSICFYNKISIAKVKNFSDSRVASPNSLIFNEEPQGSVAH